MFKRFLFLFIILTGLTTAHASERYEVELIAFKHYGVGTDDAGNLAYQLPLLPASQGVSILESLLPSQKLPTVIDGAQVFSTTPSVSLLSKSALQMTTEMKRMTRSLAFTPLIHLAWSVEISGSTAPSIRLLAGENFQGRYPLASSQIGVDVNGPLFELDGLITLFHDQQLYLETELVLREPNKYLGTSTQASSQDSSELIEFPVKQRQRINSGETYYLDHPLLGLLVKIRKV